MSFATCACCLLLVVSYGAGAVQAQDLSNFFKGLNGTFVVYDMKNERYVRYNERRCRQQFSPRSTFKISNSLIGLETGVIRDAEFAIQWNREKYPPQAHWKLETVQILRALGYLPKRSVAGFNQRRTRLYSVCGIFPLDHSHPGTHATQ